MSNYKVVIPDTIFVNDFTIIYKGKEDKQGQIVEPIEEIKTSRDEFFRKLRYFKQRTYDMNSNEIYIHEEYPVQIFKEFIESIKTKALLLNENNFNSFYQLSLKYQYYELQSKIEEFMKKRPDIQLLVNQLSTSRQTDPSAPNQKGNIKEEIDPIKEEIISKHLDICLQNDNLMELPISTLHRIFSSPKKVLKNHHLLYQFVKKMIERYESKPKDIKNPSNEKEDLQLLIGSLDYSKMTDEEIEDILSKNYLSAVFTPETAIESKKLKEIEEKVTKIESFYAEKIQKLEKSQEEREKEMKAMKLKMQQQEETIKTYESKFNKIDENKKEDSKPNRPSQIELPAQAKEIQVSQTQQDKEKPETKDTAAKESIQKKSNEASQIQNKEKIEKVPPEASQKDSVQSKSNDQQKPQKMSEEERLKKDAEKKQKRQAKKEEAFKKRKQSKSSEKDDEELLFDESSTPDSSFDASSSSSSIPITSLTAPTAPAYKLILTKEFRGKESFQGIVSELTKFHKGNINDKGIIDISGNRDDDYASFSSLVDYNYSGPNYVSEPDPDSRVCFDFKAHRVSVAAYSIKSANQRSPNYLVSWVLEGSDDKEEWVNIDSHSNDRSLCSKSKVATFVVQDKAKAEQKFRFVQLRMTGKSPRNNYIFNITNVEFFGKYYST